MGTYRRFKRLLMASIIFALVSAGIVWMMRDEPFPGGTAMLLGIGMAYLVDTALRLAYWRHRWATRLDLALRQKVPYPLFVEQKLWKSYRRNRRPGIMPRIVILAVMGIAFTAAYILVLATQSVVIGFLLGLSIEILGFHMYDFGMRWRRKHRSKPQEASSSAL